MTSKTTDKFSSEGSPSAKPRLRTENSRRPLRAADQRTGRSIQRVVTRRLASSPVR
jgi:hypothetical protein